MAAGTRGRIMQVARDLFARHGVAATPVTAIEKAAGLSAGSGAFYRHFRDKTELLTAVVDHELERVRKVPAAQVSQARPDQPAARALAAQLRADLDFLRELTPLIHILAWERDRAPNIVRKLQQTMYDRGIELCIGDLLLRAPAAPVTADATAAASVMMSAVIGYFLGIEYFGEPAAGVSPDRFTETLAALLTKPDEQSTE